MGGKISGKILIHIAFYYIKERVKQLAQLIDNFGTYGFSDMHIVIDTNSHEVQKLFPELFDFAKGKIECNVPENLQDPFMLTWCHRQHMLKNIAQYDFFMYMEDDILVPWKAMERWHEDTLLIYPYGYIRGFLRVEKDSKGALVSTDFEERVKRLVVKEIKQHKYFVPPFPFHAFWIYTKGQMADFIRNNSWEYSERRKWDRRAMAAAGMMLDNSNNCRVLIPLGDKDTIPEDAFVYHLGNRYALDEKSKFGKIPVNKLIASRRERVFNYCYSIVKQPLKSIFKDTAVWRFLRYMKKAVYGNKGIYSY